MVTSYEKESILVSFSFFFFFFLQVTSRPQHSWKTALMMMMDNMTKTPMPHGHDDEHLQTVLHALVKVSFSYEVSL